MMYVRLIFHLDVGTTFKKYCIKVFCLLCYSLVFQDNLPVLVALVQPENITEETPFHKVGCLL